MTPAKRPAQAGAGSPQAGEPEYLAVGFLRRPHGLRGELRMSVYTDFPERIRPGVVLFVGENYRQMKVTSVRPHNQFLLIGFEGIKTPEEAGLFRNTWVFVRAEDRPPLPDGEYYFHQLIGLRVRTREGRELGHVDEIIETGANDVLVVHDENGVEVLLPFIAAVIQNVDLDKQLIEVDLLPGLLDE